LKLLVNIVLTLIHTEYYQFLSYTLFLCWRSDICQLNYASGFGGQISQKRYAY
ncbi:hypothetical protein BDZ91DRAFT_845596, partial [Kalaharituber pfeilii]